jgi:hypothetical protein
MATAIKDSMTDHSPLDGTNDAINGAEVDANANVISQILDGTTATDLATDSTVAFRFTSSRAGVRLIDTDNATGAIHYGLDMEWNPGDGGQMTDGTSGVGMRFIMPDAADTQTAYARMYVLMRDDTAASDDAEFVFEAAVGGTLTTELLHMGGGGTGGVNGTVFNDDSSDIDFRIEGANTTNGFLLDAGQDAISLGGANVDGAAFTLNNLQSRTAITSVGSQFHIPAQTTNFDNSSGTIAIGTAAFIGIPTWTNGSSALTMTHSASLYIQGIPVADSNVTATNTPYALWVDAGETRLDGAATFNSTITVGVNDAGHDVKFFGDAASAFMLWDTSTDDLVLGGAAQLYLFDAAGGEHISSDGTDLTIDSGRNINLTPASGSGGNVALPANISLVFGSGEKITGDNTDLTVTSGGAINLTAITDVVISRSDGGHLKLTTSEATVVDGDVLGRIDFQAPVEGDGSAAIAVAASIWAEASDTFASGNNETDLILATGATAAATEKVRILANGRVGIGQTPTSQELEIKGDIRLEQESKDNQKIEFRNASATKVAIGYDHNREGFAINHAEAGSMGFQADPDFLVSEGKIFIGEGTGNANMTTGLTIQQAASDDQIIAFKASEVAHAMTDIAEADTYGYFQKCQADSGGLSIRGLRDADSAAGTALELRGMLGEAADATKSTSGLGIVSINSFVISSNSIAGAAGNANLLVVANGLATQFIFDADGDSHQNVGTAWTNFDDKNDALLSRSLGIVMDAGSAIQNKWDDWGRDHKEDLIQAKIIPRLTNKEIANGDDALVNTSQVMRLHNGAIWQLHCQQQNLEEVVDYQQEEIKSLKQELRLLKEAE